MIFFPKSVKEIYWKIKIVICGDHYKGRGRRRGY